jgi:hypothetical protein
VAHLNAVDDTAPTDTYDSRSASTRLAGRWYGSVNTQTSTQPPS